MRRLAAISIIALTIGMGSAVAQPPPPPPPGPPPAQYEAVPPPPGARVIWEPGHWHWNGVRYVWFGGHYVERRPEYGHYVPGHWRWAPGLGRYEWIGAHWE
jgi:hypothetical protein